MNELTCDVLVVGGSLGGVAAAMRAAEMGADTILIEESDWLGGQLTSQGVCTPDENQWIESGGGTASYRALRERIRRHYGGFRLSSTGSAQEYLNPGTCWVSRISVEPKIAHQIIHELLDNMPSLRVIHGNRIVEAERRINSIPAVIGKDLNGKETRFIASYILDATELGDLLPLAGIEHVIGAESKAETGEPDAPVDAHPEWVQPFTFPFALELRPAGENHTISKPPLYEEMKKLENYHILDGAMRGMFGELGWWTYRRVIAAENFEDIAFPCDVAMINTGSNDFKGGTLPGDSRSIDAETIQSARLASLGYVYWLQSECPRDSDGSTSSNKPGYPEFKLRSDWFNSTDGTAAAPYIRESRRIKALKTVVQQEIVVKDSLGAIHQSGPRAAFFDDSCGIGHYWLDIHEGGTEEPCRFLETQPFQIPLGALIPRNVTNVIAACKNIGTTHLTNGAFRLHPIEWNIGESAGALAAFCIQRRVSPHQVHKDTGLLRRYQGALIEAGIPIFWWGDLPYEHPGFHAAQRLSMDGFWLQGNDILFRPDEMMKKSVLSDLAAGRGITNVAVPESLTNAEAANWLAAQIYG